MGPGFGHCLVHVGGGEQPCAGREGGTDGAAVVAGTVQALVVERGGGCQFRQKARTSEHPLGVVGVQPHPLPLITRQRAVLVPDADGYRDSTEVMDQRRSADPDDMGRLEPQLCAAPAASVATPTEWPTK